MTTRITQVDQYVVTKDSPPPHRVTQADQYTVLEMEPPPNPLNITQAFALAAVAHDSQARVTQAFALVLWGAAPDLPATGTTKVRAAWLHY